ncbi:(+)-epi-alpha-bisabolol synthase-like [Henckelia pumila]|uniref:(+)-epi-alpha-bisabolol synthase-like n=1 Tax=Henckelia pumila TaxID=405737 RepID=UPI003C6DFD65
MNTSRRSGNYKPAIWDDDYLQSISSVYEGEEYIQRAKELEEKIEKILAEKMRKDSALGQMEFVDVLQRLGISYHFKNTIHTIMQCIFNMKDGWVSSDLHQVSLRFRLLRQHGYNLVPRDVFNIFLDKEGEFKKNLSNDNKGLLSLYEASYLTMEGEEIMDNAQDFATHHLEQNLKQQQQLLDQTLLAEITHSMENFPIHWRVPRLEARRFISVYEKSKDMNPLVLEFAKLDFNLLQVMYQQELKEMSRWYTNTRLAEKLSFARDHLVESFVWTIGNTFEPQFRYYRIMSAKLFLLVTLIDDIYDVYGTVDELQLFTLAVERWDINALDQLPDYMKICFFVLFNSMNELSFDILKTQGFGSISCLKEMWAKLCKAYMAEARWFSSGYTPTLNEFLENGLVSISGPLVIVHAYLCIAKPIEEKTLKDLMKLSDLVRWISTIVRLSDDLCTSSDEMKKGDVAKSIQCIMQEADCSEEEACGLVKSLIHTTTRKFNLEIFSNYGHYSKDMVETFTNFIRAAQYMYHINGEGHGISHACVSSLILESIPLS